MHFKQVIVVALVLLVPTWSAAEIYKYRDQSGVMRWTNDLSEVPVDQRPQMQILKETQSAPPKTTAADAEGSEQAVAQARDADLVQRAQQLDAEKTVLDQEYQALMQESQALEQMREQARSNPEEFEAYQQKVKALNTQIETYESKRQAFQEKVTAFQADTQP
jgi:chromosome segregation ATPase